LLKKAGWQCEPEAGKSNEKKLQKRFGGLKKKG